MDYMKAAFEKFVINHDPSGHCTNLLAMNESQTNYLHPHVDIAWSAWQASRDAIEIELPEPFDLHCDPSPEMVYDADDTNDAITSHGIRIKGKTE